MLAAAARRRRRPPPAAAQRHRCGDGVGAFLLWNVPEPRDGSRR